MSETSSAAAPHVLVTDEAMKAALDSLDFGSSTTIRAVQRAVRAAAPLIAAAACKQAEGKLAALKEATLMSIANNIAGLIYETAKAERDACAAILQQRAKEIRRNDAEWGGHLPQTAQF